LKNIIGLLLIITFFSCFQKEEKEIVRQIRMFEFQRNSHPENFENFIINPSGEIRVSVADAMAKIGSSAHLPLLKELLKDKNSAVISKALFAIGQIGDQDSLLCALLKNKQYNAYRIQILNAIGKSKNESLIDTLLAHLPSLEDSLKISAIQSITHIAPIKFRNIKKCNAITAYLKYPNAGVRGAAAYFFSRHPHYLAIRSLIKASLRSESTWNKYRLKALSRSLENYTIPTRDSALFDTLKQNLITDLYNNSNSWRHKIYEISILSHIEDSSSFKVVVEYLRNPNPHLRQTAIAALARMARSEAKQSLLRVFQEASWADKGNIIFALSKKYPQIAYPLIQQNLDKGNFFSKQLLLKSLANIKNKMSLNQLRQFLLVPNNRLKFTAFRELRELKKIEYKQAKEMLLSGDIALATVAAEWIIENPKRIRFDDLSMAYAQFSEPVGLDAMQVILNGIMTIGSSESIQFLQNIYQNTSSFAIAKQIEHHLTTSQIQLSLRHDLSESLYVPEEKYFTKEPVQASIQTEKGDILIQLLPDIAPATVSNFISLAKNGFYNNLTFHRVVSDFVVQGGDPRGDGWGGPDYSIPCEYNEELFNRGTIGMATSGKDTGGSQFFICHSEQPHLNRRYTVFGKVVNGMGIVDNIEVDDKIIKVVIQN
jgi:cyclophilin family peptidyl-prolyl cis-trans isomerase/HEAT repeat protein